MLRAFCFYFWSGLCRAWRGSVNSALNWAGIVGVGVVGAYLERRGSTMSDPHTWQGLVGWTLVYTAVAWVIILAIRLILVAPFQLYYEQKIRADKLEELPKLANDTNRSPSFDMGFDHVPFNADGMRRLLDSQSILRIWVENLDNRPIEDCRVVIENFGPISPIRKGAMLLPDIRGDDDKSTQFHLAATERKFFRFIEVESHDFALRHEGGYRLAIRCDEEGTGSLSFLNRPSLEVGKHYFATIVVHGKEANSRRIDLVIDAISTTGLYVVEADSTASYRKEIA